MGVGGVRRRASIFVPSKVGTFRHGIGQIKSYLVTFITLVIFSPLFLCYCLTIGQRSKKPTVFGRRQVNHFKGPFCVCGFEDVQLSTRGFNPTLCGNKRSSQLAGVKGVLHRRRLSRLPRL